MRWLESELSIKSPTDWYAVSTMELRRLGSNEVLKQNGGLYKVLKSVYPTFPLDVSRFSSLQNWGKSQRAMVDAVKKCLPVDVLLLENFKHPSLTYGSSTRNMELDIFLPDLFLAFEYQGEHHYCHTFLFGSPVEQRLRDKEKMELCNALGVTLIEIPYWWDRDWKTLLATIHKYRPDMIGN